MGEGRGEGERRGKGERRGDVRNVRVREGGCEGRGEEG